MTRYRLRFLLQEIDLPQGDTLLGRSASCHVTIDDPLVSRQHAKLSINESVARISDLGSRNGVSVNGRPIVGEQELKDNDRIRIGTQELVFCAVSELPRTGNRPTGFMCHCAACGLPYPAELVECPSCGSRERSDEETISGFNGDESQRNWTLELLVEVLLKAVSLQRWDDAERVLRRARVNVDERLTAVQSVDTKQLRAVADAATRVALVLRSAEWAAWGLHLFAHLGEVPASDTCKGLTTLPASERALLAVPAALLIDTVLARGGPRLEDRGNFVRLEALRNVGGGDHE